MVPAGSPPASPLGPREDLARVDARRLSDQRRANVRLALILASIALFFGVGFVVKFVFFGS